MDNLLLHPFNLLQWSLLGRLLGRPSTPTGRVNPCRLLKPRISDSLWRQHGPGLAATRVWGPPTDEHLHQRRLHPLRQGAGPFLPTTLSRQRCPGGPASSVADAPSLVVDRSLHRTDQDTEDAPLGLDVQYEGPRPLARARAGQISLLWVGLAGGWRWGGLCSPSES